MRPEPDPVHAMPEIEDVCKGALKRGESTVQLDELVEEEVFCFFFVDEDAASASCSALDCWSSPPTVHRQSPPPKSPLASLGPEPASLPLLSHATLSTLLE